MSTQEPCFPDYYDYSERRVCQETKNEIGPDGFCGPHRPPSDMSASAYQRVLTAGTKAKRRQLEAEISHVTGDVLRAKLRHSLSKLCQFIDDDLEAAVPTPWAYGQVCKARTKWQERAEELHHALTVVLPMAKGYAAAHRVGANAEKIAWAEEIADRRKAEGG